jgi:hypothetical protein
VIAPSGEWADLGGTRMFVRGFVMNKDKPKTHFGTLLATINVLALTYPVSLLIRAQRIDENLFAIVVLLIVIVLLVAVDAVSIVFSRT